MDKAAYKNNSLYLCKGLHKVYFLILKKKPKFQFI